MTKGPERMMHHNNLQIDRKKTEQTVEEKSKSTAIYCTQVLLVKLNPHCLQT